MQSKTSLKESVIFLSLDYLFDDEDIRKLILQKTFEDNAVFLVMLEESLKDKKGSPEVVTAELEFDDINSADTFYVKSTMKFFGGTTKEYRTDVTTEVKYKIIEIPGGDVIIISKNKIADYKIEFKIGDTVEAELN